MTKRKPTKRNLRKSAENKTPESPHPLMQEATDSAKLDDESTASLIVKMLVYFDDGSTKNFVCQGRFLQVRDALKVQSDANALLNKQAEMLEEKIRELEAKCKSLEDMTQDLIAQLNTDASFVPDSDFKNPLP